MQAIHDIALRLDGWLETTCKRSGAGVWVSTSTAWSFGLGWSVDLVIFSRTASVGPRLHPWPWVMEPCRMEARLLGKEYGGFLRRSCVSAIDFVLSFCVESLFVLMQHVMRNAPKAFFILCPENSMVKQHGMSILVPLDPDSRSQLQLIEDYHSLVTAWLLAF